ncbi:MAG TPA: DUF5677 domain-containing protein [Desulfitobacteriaceae bacterium]|nr:DUF5677 domain-containing protein [Desulfitobacteriaceae bacterium]
MQNSKLSEHDFKKGKFSTAFGEFIKQHGQENIWFLDRLPEYLWLLLILHRYGRKEGMARCARILSNIQSIAPQVALPKMSALLSLTEEVQRSIFGRIIEIVTAEVISPLTIIFTYSKNPCFAECFSVPNLSVEDRFDILKEVLKEAVNHQSDISTDIRFLIIYFEWLSGTLVMEKEMAELVFQYPQLSHEDVKIKLICTMIRSMEIAIPNSERDETYLKLFWEGISQMDDCQLGYVGYDAVTKNVEEYVAALKKIMLYYSSVLNSITPLDNRLTVLLGIATYAYKRILEVVEHSLYNSISGRSAVRCVIECYIVTKYLLHEEHAHQDIWTEYQYYGIGQYKLIVERILESGKDIRESHVNAPYLDALVQEYIDKEFIEMDTSYFDRKNVREKAIIAGEKELFGFYYDYDSAFEHGLWGAIRESGMLKCTSPAHQYHCIPDIENIQKLPSVWNDCRDNMRKIIEVLRELYGLPKHLYCEVIGRGN